MQTAVGVGVGGLTALVLFRTSHRLTPQYTTSSEFDSCFRTQQRLRLIPMFMFYMRPHVGGGTLGNLGRMGLAGFGGGMGKPFLLGVHSLECHHGSHRL